MFNFFLFETARQFLRSARLWRRQSVEAQGGTTLNLFAEPQVTQARDGVAPKFQLFSGLNMQFPIGH